MATQVTVENESPKHSTIGYARKTRNRRKSKRGEVKVDVQRLALRRRECRWEENSKESNVRTTT